MGDTSADLPRTPGEAPSESKGVLAAGFERVLRSVSDPSQSEANDFYFLVLAVAVYLACLLVVEHIRAVDNEDDGGTRGLGDAPIVRRETQADQGDDSARRVESNEAYERTNRVARS